MLHNITLSAEKELIELARRKAELANTTLNAEFRRWLEQYANSSRTAADLAVIMDQLNYARSEKTFSRDELNER